MICGAVDIFHTSILQLMFLIDTRTKMFFAENTKAIKQGQLRVCLSLPCPPQQRISHHHFLSTQEPAAPGGNPSFTENMVKSGRLVGGHQHLSSTISGWTNSRALSLSAHEGKKNTRGHADCQALRLC